MAEIESSEEQIKVLYMYKLFSDILPNSAFHDAFDYDGFFNWTLAKQFAIFLV